MPLPVAQSCGSGDVQPDVGAFPEDSLRCLLPVGVPPRPEHTELNIEPYSGSRG